MGAGKNTLQGFAGKFWPAPRMSAFRPLRTAAIFPGARPCGTAAYRLLFPSTARIWNRPERLAVMTAADAIHMLRASCLPSLPDDLLSKAHVIPNAVTLPVLQRACKDHYSILSMGRLEREKQNHLLVDAFAALAPDFPQWRLEIWGIGPEEGRLRKQIYRLGLQGRARIRCVGDFAESYKVAQGEDLLKGGNI